jgi:hypothetical protein
MAQSFGTPSGFTVPGQAEQEFARKRLERLQKGEDKESKKPAPPTEPKLRSY